MRPVVELDVNEKFLEQAQYNFCKMMEYYADNLYEDANSGNIHATLCALSDMMYYVHKYRAILVALGHEDILREMEFEVINDDSIKRTVAAERK